MLKVIVQLPDEIPAHLQGQALMPFERHLRVLTGLDVQVFKAKMADDSKLRVAMTPEERAKI